MSDNKTQPTNISVETFLASIDKRRVAEAKIIVDIMDRITGKPAKCGARVLLVLIRFTIHTTAVAKVICLYSHLVHEKPHHQIYFMEGFSERYVDELQRLGTHKISKACLYVSKLSSIDLDVLTDMLEKSYHMYSKEIVINLHYLGERLFCYDE